MTGSSVSLKLAAAVNKTTGSFPSSNLFSSLADPAASRLSDNCLLGGVFFLAKLIDQRRRPWRVYLTGYFLFISIFFLLRLQTYPDFP
jgi:hypothetical protein